MAQNKTKLSASSLHPRIRVLSGEKIALGPGKAELLQHISTSGSIAKAAKIMNMSYMKAWLLVKEMHEAFKEPVIEKLRGGAVGGGAKLTEFGIKVLNLYNAMEAKASDAAQPEFHHLRALLK